MRFPRYPATTVALVLSLLAAGAVSGMEFPPNQSPASAGEKNEKALVAVLQSTTAGKPEKAIVCKRLAIYGTADSVPALAVLLTDAELASWSRIALEAIPGPAPEAALRDALSKVQGRLAIGVINSIGFRRDAKAVDALAAKLADADVEVASAAAASLGKIGGEAATRALEQALAGKSADVRTAAAEGLNLIAEQAVAAGNRESATRLYDLVRKADVFQPRQLTATRGAILVRQTAGISLLLEQLRSEDKHFYNLALRVARELSGPQVQEALISEMGKSAPDRQGQLILVLADRNEAGSLAVILRAAQAGPTSVRVVALGALEAVGNVSCVPALLEAAVDSDDQLAQAAKTTLARLQGPGVDAEYLAQLQKAGGKTLQVLVDLAAQRRIEGALPVILKCAEDPDAGVRATAVEAIGAVGDKAQVGDLVRLLQKNQDKAEREAIGKSLVSLAGRYGPDVVPNLLPLARGGDLATRAVALDALAAVGGPDALAAVRAASTDADEAVRDEAVRTLSSWPNRWPEDATILPPLMELAKSATKEQHKVLAIRGYVRYLQGSKTLDGGTRMAKLTELLPLLTRPEEKRLAISVLGSMQSGPAMRRLIEFTADPAVGEDACRAIVNHKQLQNFNKKLRQEALQAVLDKAKNTTTREKAQNALQAVQ